jgi:phosphoribosylformimino-5-aminoimidazole carboxamide ribotide isomerase
MLLLPAIDIRGGQCVRLRQGDYAQETVFDADPIAVAKRFVEQGAESLHLVDLDGAKEGHPVSLSIVSRIIRETQVPCQIGGGIRTDDHIKSAFDAGAARVIIGTKALQDPLWVRQLSQQYPHRIILGLDARGGKLSSHGWLQDSSMTVTEVAQGFDKMPIASVVFTDIAKDGMLAGPNLEALKELRDAIQSPLVASGGVTTIEHLIQLQQIGVNACIIGRAIYEGKIDLVEAIQTLKKLGS